MFFCFNIGSVGSNQVCGQNYFKKYFTVGAKPQFYTAENRESSAENRREVCCSLQFSAKARRYFAIHPSLPLWLNREY